MQQRPPSADSLPLRVQTPEVARNTSDAPQVIKEEIESEAEYYDEEYDEEEVEDELMNSRESRRSSGATRLKAKGQQMAQAANQRPA